MCFLYLDELYAYDVCGRSRTYLMWRARCSLLVKLSLHGGNSVQKNLCPFFFLDGLPSASTLSASETAPSPSDSPISTSSDSSAACGCDSSRFDTSCLSSTEDGGGGCGGDTKVLLKGEVGRGRCELIPLNVGFVGVVGADWVESSGGREGTIFGGRWTGARGVVGVVASAE